MKSTLLIVAHPNLIESNANRAVLEKAREIQNLEILDLYAEYPQFYISVKKEKQRLLRNQVIILQHPFFWYNVPPLLKLWIDEVLELGFAYGEGGTALAGKELLVSITTGGSASAYQKDGANSFTIEHFLAAYIQTAKLCGMKWWPHLVLHQADVATSEEVAQHAEVVQARIRQLMLSEQVLS